MSVKLVDNASTDSTTDTWHGRWREKEKDKQLSLSEIFLLPKIRSISQRIFWENQTFRRIKEKMKYCRNTGTVKFVPVFSLNRPRLTGISVNCFTTNCR